MYRFMATGTIGRRLAFPAATTAPARDSAGHLATGDRSLGATESAEMDQACSAASVPLSHFPVGSAQELLDPAYLFSGEQAGSSPRLGVCADGAIVPRIRWLAGAA